MSNSYVSNCVHVIFATKDRARFLNSAVRSRLYPYLVALAKGLGIEIVSIGGVEDHIHVLFALPPTPSLSEAMKKLKANTSRWINETFATRKFAWQEGYGAFSVGLGRFQQLRTTLRGKLSITESAVIVPS